MMTATPDEPRPDPRVTVKADVGDYVSVMRRVAERALRDVAREDEADRA